MWQEMSPPSSEVMWPWPFPMTLGMLQQWGLPGQLIKLLSYELETPKEPVPGVRMARGFQPSCTGQRFN